MGDPAARELAAGDSFGEGWRTRDLDRWIDALAPDVVLHSPLLTTPFQGREVARELYGVLFDLFGQVTIVDRWRAGDTEVVFWSGELRHQTVEGVDVLRYRPEGTIGEIRVLMRPLTAIGVFAAAVGPAFARRRGRAAAALTWLLSQPLGPLFRVLDRVAPMLLPLRGRPGTTASGSAPGAGRDSHGSPRSLLARRRRL